MRTLVLGPSVRLLGEMRTLRLGIVSVALGLATLPLARDFWELGLAVLLIPVGTALLFPSTTSILSHRAQAERVGLVLGVQQSFGGVARMIGPLWAGAVFQHLGIAVPFWIAAGLMLGLRIFAATLKQDPPSDQDEPEPEVVLPSEPT
jgi:MFS family permease